ncbi:hypothetical protein PCLA_14r0202 [Pseudomonas citronellolis]|nr:hypothetical protein PCLA_14r0202 [Pseudomonas citronellolis]
MFVRHSRSPHSREVVKNLQITLLWRREAQRGSSLRAGPDSVRRGLAAILA